MALISLRQMLDHAAEYSYGVPAFNVNNLEQMRAIMMAADQKLHTNMWIIVNEDVALLLDSVVNFWGISENFPVSAEIVPLQGGNAETSALICTRAAC